MKKHMMFILAMVSFLGRSGGAAPTDGFAELLRSYITSTMSFAEGLPQERHLFILIDGDGCPNCVSSVVGGVERYCLGHSWSSTILSYGRKSPPDAVRRIVGKRNVKLDDNGGFQRIHSEGEIACGIITERGSVVRVVAIDANAVNKTFAQLVGLFRATSNEELSAH